MTDRTPTGAERYLADRLKDPEYRAAHAAFLAQFPLPEAADRTPNELADALEADAESLHNLDDMAYDGKEARLRAAAVLLRRQGEQLDTLRAAILRHRDETKCCDECAEALVQPRELDEPWNHDGRLWAAAAVPQDPERCACGKPATGTVGGVPTCGDDR